MALSAYERKLRQLEREREEKNKLVDKTYPYLKTPFFEYAEEDPDWNEIQFLLSAAGIEPPHLSDDSGPHDHVLDELEFDEQTTEESFEGFGRNSIGRAELLAGFLMTTGRMLAHVINKYKKEELERHLKDLQMRDVETAEERAALFDEAARIMALLKELDKNTRTTIPVYQVKDW